MEARLSKSANEYRTIDDAEAALSTVNAADCHFIIEVAAFLRTFAPLDCKPFIIIK